MQWFESRACKIGGIYGIAALAALIIEDHFGRASFTGDDLRSGFSRALEFAGDLLPKSILNHEKIVAHLGEDVAISYAIFNGAIILLILFAAIAYGASRLRDPENRKVSVEPIEIDRFVRYWKLIRGLAACIAIVSTYALVIGTGLSARHGGIGARGLAPNETIYGDSLFAAQIIWSMFAVICWIVVADISKAIGIAVRVAASAQPVRLDAR